LRSLSISDAALPALQNVMRALALGARSHSAAIRPVPVSCERKTPDKLAGDQTRQPAHLVPACRKRMNGVYDQRALHRRQRPQTRIGTFEFLHNETVRRVAKTSAAVSFQIGRVEAQRAHAWYEVFWELACSMERNDLGHGFLLH